MVPTIQVGDHILVDKVAYGRVEVPLTERVLRQIPGRESPRRGDVIVFLAPAQASADHQRRDFVKRVIATEGQTIEIRRKQVYIDGKPWDDSHAVFVSGAPDPAATDRAPLPGVKSCGSLTTGGGNNCGPLLVPPGTIEIRVTTPASGVPCRPRMSGGG